MAWELLFNSDSGLASLFTIVFVVLIAVGFGRYFSRRIAEDGRSQQP